MGGKGNGGTVMEVLGQSCAAATARAAHSIPFDRLEKQRRCPSLKIPPLT